MHGGKGFQRVNNNVHPSINSSRITINSSFCSYRLHVSSNFARIILVHPSSCRLELSYLLSAFVREKQLHQYRPWRRAVRYNNTLFTVGHTSTIAPFVAIAIHISFIESDQDRTKVCNSHTLSWKRHTGRRGTSTS